MKKLLSITFFISLSCSSLNAEGAEVNTGLSVEQREDLELFVRNCETKKVQLSDDGKVLIFADPSVVEPIAYCAAGLGLTALLFLLPRKKKGENDTLAMVAISGVLLAGSSYFALKAIHQLEKKNKKTPWLVLDNEQIAIDEEGGVSVVNWDAVAAVTWKTSKTNNSVTESVVKLKDKNDKTMRTIDALELPIDLKKFCNLIDYYLSIQD